MPVTNSVQALFTSDCLSLAGHDDYRDRLPTPLDEVVREYQDVVKV